MELASPYVYQGESEEEEISQRALEEGMWISDDEEEHEEEEEYERRPTAQRTSSGFWGGILKRIGSRKTNTHRKKNKGKPVPPAAVASPQEKDSDSSSDEEVKSKSTKVPESSYADLQFNESTPSERTIRAPEAKPAPRKLQKQRQQRIRWKEDKGISSGIKTRRADTNILAVRFNTLREAGHLHTGDAQFCSNPECGAVVSHLTKLIGEEDDEKKIWNCEFCGTATELDIVPEEIPSKDDTTYLITPAAIMAEGGGGAGTIGMDESLVVFCIDTSGSMGFTTEVPGHYNIRGAKEREDRLLNSLPPAIAAELRQPEFRMRQGSQHNTTWISRMESLQAAVDTHLSQLVHSEPNKRVSVVTFSDDVTIIGDGRMVPVTIAGEKLSDTKAVIDVGREIPLPATVRETQKALSKKIFSLEGTGQTALGPAALASVVIASQRPGSRVVLCTDGLANVGLGSLDVTGNAQAYAMAENFYEDLGDVAMEKGVTVSLLSIKGSDCRVIELGQVATRTGGQTTLVDPLTVTEEFGSILSNPVLATDVVTKIVLHNDVYFRTEDSKENVIVKQVGNVTADTELTFEYGVRKAAKSAKMLSSQLKTKAKASAKSVAAEVEDDDHVKAKPKAGATGATADKVVPPQLVNGQPQLPFQLQIEYTNSDGDRCLRVITQTKPVTQDRIVAERAMDTAIISSHVGKKAAQLTMQGEFTKARVQSLATQRMLQEHSRTNTARRREYTTYCNNLMPLENRLNLMQVTERSHGLDHSDNEEEFIMTSDLMCTSYAQPATVTSVGSSHLEPVADRRKTSSKSQKESSRRQEMSDDLACDVLHLMSNSSTSYRD